MRLVLTNGYDLGCARTAPKSLSDTGYSYENFGASSTFIPPVENRALAGVADTLSTIAVRKSHVNSQVIESGRLADTFSDYVDREYSLLF